MNLLDVVVLNTHDQWWSLHELTSGTRRWSLLPRDVTASGRWAWSKRPA